jgi:hypothetical protein
VFVTPLKADTVIAFVDLSPEPFPAPEIIFKTEALADKEGFPLIDWQAASRAAWAAVKFPPPAGTEVILPKEEFEVLTVGLCVDS